MRLLELSKLKFVYFLVLLVSLVSNLLALLMVSEQELLKGDSPQYVRMAHNFVNNQVLSLEDHTDPEKPRYPTLARMPGFPFVLALINIVFGNSIWNYVYFNFVCLTLTCLIITRAVFQWAGKGPALISGLLCATHHTYLFMATSIESEVSTNLLILIILILIKLLPSSQNILTAITTGSVIGLGMLYREPVVMVTVVGFFVLVIQFRVWNRQSIRQFIVASVCLVTFYSIWPIRNYYLSGEFIPVTLFAKGCGINVKSLQDHGFTGLDLTPEFWLKDYNTEIKVMQRISLKTNYQYYVLSGNLEKSRLDISPKKLLIDVDQFYPDEYSKQVNEDHELLPTIKNELIYLRYCQNITKLINEKTTPFEFKLKLTFKRIALLYAANDQMPYSKIKFGNMIHRLYQVRWYCCELPFAILGITISLRRCLINPHLQLIIIYSVIVLISLHVESRYGMLPILFLKAYAAFGIYEFWRFLIKCYFESTVSEVKPV